MKLFSARGNPRRGGVCDKLADLFLEGAKNSGCEIVDVRIAEKNISPCAGCFSCQKSKYGECAFNDDMSELLEEFSSADAVLFVSPIYFYSQSALLKKFIERCFPLIRGYGLAGKIEVKCRPKKMATISVAMGLNPIIFNAANSQYAAIADAFGFEHSLDIKRGESLYFGNMGDGSKRVAKILQAYKTCGEEFARFGAASKSSKELAQARVSTDDTTFAKGAKLFWELAHSGKKDF